MSNFAETTGGKIFIGAVVAVIGTLFGAFLTWVTLSNQPPVASIVPETLDAHALLPVIFSAAGSNDPDGDQLHYEWSLNALPFGANPAARCSPTTDPATANCRFVMPGTHAVTVAVEDEWGARRSTSASITVTITRGYVSLYFRASSDETIQAAAERALLYAVDWGKVQSMVGRPILLFDPDSGSAVYASTIDRDLTRAQDALASKFVRDNFKIGGFGLTQETKDFIAMQAGEVGMTIFFFDVPFGEVVTGTEAGIGDGGFILSDSPEAFTRLQRGE